MTRKPAFVSAMEKRGVKLIYVGLVWIQTRRRPSPTSKLRWVSRYLIWQHGTHGWDAVLYDRLGHSVNMINYGLAHEPTKEDTEGALKVYAAVRRIRAAAGRVRQRKHGRYERKA